MKQEIKQDIIKVKELGLEGIRIRHGYELLGITVKELSEEFGVTKKRIYEAYRDKAPSLLLKMYDLLQVLLEYPSP